LNKRKYFGEKKLFLFLIKFFIIFFILSTLVGFVDLSFFTNYLTFLVGKMAGAVFVGNVIFVEEASFVVSNYCTGLMSASILAAIIFALKKPELREKIILFLFGLCLLLVINVPRLLLVVVAAQSGFDAELVHSITWFIMSALILAIWYYGTKTLAKKEFSGLL
jgi:exosortase/archaeosortase family protein